ncbi:MAG: OmpA family protein, partial [Myxococcota bacterium]
EKYGEDHECVSSKCEVKPECRSDGDCSSVGDGLVCRSQKCVPECTEDADCPTSMKCEDQKCVPECASDADCTPPEQCIDGACSEPLSDSTNVSGSCMPTSSGGGDLVQLITIPFDFNDFSIRLDARESLNQNAECLRQVEGQITIVLEGHADERGTQEYNLALGEKRANAVRSYLRNLGIDANIMTTRSMGENRPTCRQETESCFQQNRRVEFIQRTSR